MAFTGHKGNATITNTKYTNYRFTYHYCSQRDGQRYRSLFLSGRIAGQSDAELIEYLVVNLAKHHGGMNLTAI